jgi:uncharacterized protein (DUF2141 family)
MTPLVSGAIGVLAAAALAAAPAGVNLTVRVGQTRDDRGRVLVALYDSPDGFPGGRGAVRSAAAAIENGRAVVAFDDLPPGTYAVAVVHDENGNDRLDTGFLGIPREGIGASNAAQGRFGPARFGKARFVLSADATIEVALVYPGL